MAERRRWYDSKGTINNDESAPHDDSKASTETTTSNANVFANDGSFLEMFKKKIEEQTRQNQLTAGAQQSPSSETSGDGDPITTHDDDHTKTSRLKEDDDTSCSGGDNEQAEEKTKQEGEPVKKKYSLLSHVGKRRDGKLTLKTGQVKKPKPSDEDSEPKDAFSKYMSEVEKYKAHVCSDDDNKVRPLVK